MAVNGWATHMTFEAAFPSNEVPLKNRRNHKNPLPTKLLGFIAIIGHILGTVWLWFYPERHFFEQEYVRWEAGTCCKDLMVMLIGNRNVAMALVGLLAWWKEGQQLRFWSAFWLLELFFTVQCFFGAFEYYEESHTKAIQCFVCGGLAVVSVFSLWLTNRKINSTPPLNPKKTNAKKPSTSSKNQRPNS